MRERKKQLAKSTGSKYICLFICIRASVHEVYTVSKEQCLELDNWRPPTRTLCNSMRNMSQ